MSKKDINGVLLLDKPSGITSNKALQTIKNCYDAKKAGHIGTLDPMASGLLPICFGEATKFSSLLLNSKKEYIATIRLGFTSDSYDADGVISFVSDTSIDINTINDVLKKFIGEIAQIPPKLSAIKVNGKALYKYVRNNEVIDFEIKSRNITIEKLDLLQYDPIARTIVIKVLCSKGTYIRSLAHDIGQKLQCGGYLSGLIRTQTGNFDITQAITLEGITQICKIPNNDIDKLQQLHQLLLPMDVMLFDIDILHIDNHILQDIKVGHQHIANNYHPQLLVKLYYQENFLGIAKIIDGHIIQPLRLIDTKSSIFNQYI